jgi:hypothetical protein
MNSQTNTPASNPEGYTKHKRLAVWQATHKQLLQNDAPYRKRHVSFLITIACLASAMVLFYLPFFGVHLLGFKLDVAVIAGLAAAIVLWSVRQLLFQNRSIRRWQSCH